MQYVNRSDWNVIGQFWFPINQRCPPHKEPIWLDRSIMNRGYLTSSEKTRKQWEKGTMQATL